MRIFSDDGNGAYLSPRHGHRWLLSTWNVASAAKELNFKYF